MGKRIAPALHAALDNHPWVQGEGPMMAARAELRALLAVARAANKAWYAAERGTPEVEALGRALARLDRVGAKGGGR